MNNTILITDNFGLIPNLQCISGSKKPDIGQWITPNGEDIIDSTVDPFEVVIGGTNDPGYLEIVATRALVFAEQGVYTCQIPDETGVTNTLHVGIYLPAYISKPLSPLI